MGRGVYDQGLFLGDKAIIGMVFEKSGFSEIYSPVKYAIVKVNIESISEL